MVAQKNDPVFFIRLLLYTFKLINLHAYVSRLCTSLEPVLTNVTSRDCQGLSRLGRWSSIQFVFQIPLCLPRRIRPWRDIKNKSGFLRKAWLDQFPIFSPWFPYSTMNRITEGQADLRSFVTFFIDLRVEQIDICRMKNGICEIELRLWRCKLFDDRREIPF